MVGLGRMGANMVRRLMRGGHSVVGHDPNANVRRELEKEGMRPAGDIETLIKTLRESGDPVVVWLMIPSGPPVDAAIDRILPLLKEGDILVDGGNSRYKDTVRRSKTVSERLVSYLDCGTSGGIWGLEVGYCLMVGGPEEAFSVLEPVFRTLAPPEGYRHVGPSGAGHFVKMVHNGIEYALLQAYGEGFDLLKNGPYDLDLHGISQLWNQGSVVRSWLLELLERALRENPGLSGVRGYVEDSGEGRWTVEAAIEYGVFAPTLAFALMERFASRQGDLFSNKVIAALRNEFGGHRILGDGKPSQP
jgi:6-phosphogluconate dehydrogenase